MSLKTIRIFNIMIVKGTKMELRDIEKLAEGKHHVHRNPGSRTKGVVAEKGDGKCATCDNFTKGNEDLSVNGACIHPDGSITSTTLHNTCIAWRKREEDKVEEGGTSPTEAGSDRESMAGEERVDPGTPERSSRENAQI